MSGKRSVLRLHVVLTASDEVQQLRARVAALEAEVQLLRSERDRIEFLYRCETLINLQFQDLCREHKVRIPPRFFKRPEASLHRGVE